METQASALPGLEFGPEQIATFAPLAQTIETFAIERGLGLERTFDRDPAMTYSAYFISWATRGQRAYVRIGALAPLVVGTAFEIAAQVGLKQHREWSYSASEGAERLLEILGEAAQFVESSLLSPSLPAGV